MGIEKLNYDIQRKTLEPKRKESGYERKKLQEKYLRRQKEKTQRANNRMMRRIMTYAVGVAVLGIITLIRYNTIFTLQTDIKNINGEIKILSENNEDLNIKISEGLSLEKIEKIAKDKLKMIYPSKDDVVDIIP